MFEKLGVRGEKLFLRGFKKKKKKTLFLHL